MIDLNAEATLDQSLQFQQPLGANSTNPQHVFLTGATGFLGVYLVDELLRKTDATLHCLVRGTDAALRLKRKLQFFGLWCDEMTERIAVVVGDLAEPYFGLTISQFAQLAAQIDVIYHNGAQVSAMYPYERLKAANVTGTECVLQLAGMIHTKPVHFVSTLGVFFGDEYQHRTVTEMDVLSSVHTVRGGYKQSKWVAEQLVQQAQTRGLPAKIYRLGRIWGDSRTGIMTEFGDLLVTIVQSSVVLGCFPSADTTLKLAPVDFASRAIVHLAQQSNEYLYHICNPQPVEWRTFWHAACASGYPVEEVSYAAWVAKIKQRRRIARDQKVWSILHHLLRSPIYMFQQKPHFDVSKTMTTLAKGGIICPTIDRHQLKLYLDSFAARGYFAQ